MKAFILQFFICFAIGEISVVLEKYFSVETIQEYFSENALSVLFGLFAVNIASITYVIFRLLTLEADYKKPYHFDGSKKAAKRSIYEQFFMIVLAYSSMFFTPILSYFSFPEEKSCIAILLGLIPDAILRATVFMTLYSTSDCSKSIIDSSLNPVLFQKKHRK